jgi:hypothetical protein
MATKATIPPELAAATEGRDYIKTAEFAHYLNVSAATVRKNYCMKGECFGIRPLKLGRNLLWSVASIAQLLKEGVQ